MRIAVTYENGEVFQHFGHTNNFKIYDVENNEIKNVKIVDTNGEGHEALASLLVNLNVDVLICGGIGAGALNALSSMKIKVCAGVIGNTDDAVCKFLDDKLEFNSIASCKHHNHEHTCHEHKCND